MGGKTILVSYGVRLDALAGRPRAHGGGDSPLRVSRGFFAGEVGVPRLLTLFERFGVRSSWFVPGQSIETFPDEAHMVVEAGHEVGVHGYGHEIPMAMTPEQEEEVLERSLELVLELTGARPRGYAAPGCEPSPVTARLLLSRGFVYDHSLMHDDIHPYYLRAGDGWTSIDYARPASEWMKPLVRGGTTALIEIPVNGNLCDRAPLRRMNGEPASRSGDDLRAMERHWRDTFDWIYRECDYAVLPITLHPDRAAQPPVLLMHERLFEHMSAHPGVSFVTMDEVATDFARRHPRED